MHRRSEDQLFHTRIMSYARMLYNVQQERCTILQGFYNTFTQEYNDTFNC